MSTGWTTTSGTCDRAAPSALAGGLGSAVAEVHEGAMRKKFKRLALPHEWLLDKFGLMPPHGWGL